MTSVMTFEEASEIYQGLRLRSGSDDAAMGALSILMISMVGMNIAIDEEVQ